MSKKNLLDDVREMINHETLLELAKITLQDILDNHNSKDLFSKSSKRSLFVNAFMTGFVAGAAKLVEEVITKEKPANLTDLN